MAYCSSSKRIVSFRRKKKLKSETIHTNSTSRLADSKACWMFIFVFKLLSVLSLEMHLNSSKGRRILIYILRSVKVFTLLVKQELYIFVHTEFKKRYRWTKMSLLNILIFFQNCRNKTQGKNSVNISCWHYCYCVKPQKIN